MVAARSRAVGFSLVAHAAVAIALWQISRDEAPPAAYDLEIDLPEEEPAKEEPEPVEDEPEEQTPETPPEVARSEERPPPPPESTPEPESPPGPAPLPTGVEMENSTNGGDGPAVATPPRPAPARPAAVARPDKGAPEPAPRPADACAEPASKPKPTSRPRDIEYLDDARAREIEGRLVLVVTVAPDGSVTEVAVKSPVDPALDAAAVEAVKTWRFEPARRCGKPVEGTFTLARRFVLGD